MKYVKRKSLLYRTGVEYGDYTINHIEGCAHGCRYPCYAMQMSKRFGRISTYQEWLQPKLVVNALELLEDELPRLRSRIKFVHLCFMSDPFMFGYPEVTQMTLAIISRLNQAHIPVTTLSKGLYPDNLLKYAIDTRNEYGITLVSNKAAYCRYYEPNSAKWFCRIRSLELLAAQGARTWISMEPYPTPNIVKQDIADILDRVSFADKIVFGRLNYNASVRGYSDYKNFYDEHALAVAEFCDARGIECHIKNGTCTDSAEMTLRGYRECSWPSAKQRPVTGTIIA